MSIYDEIGGDETLSAFLGIFYFKVMTDPELKPFFKGVDMSLQRHTKHKFLKTYLNGDTKGANSYLRRTHAHLVKDMELSEYHFQKASILMENALKELCIPDHLINEYMGKINLLKNAILDK